MWAGDKSADPSLLSPGARGVLPVWEVSSGLRVGRDKDDDMQPSSGSHLSPSEPLLRAAESAVDTVGMGRRGGQTDPGQHTTRPSAWVPGTPKNSEPQIGQLLLHPRASLGG